MKKHNVITTNEANEVWKILPDTYKEKLQNLYNLLDESKSFAADEENLARLDCGMRLLDALFNKENILNQKEMETEKRNVQSQFNDVEMSPEYKAAVDGLVAKYDIYKNCCNKVHEMIESGDYSEEAIENMRKETKLALDAFEQANEELRKLPKKTFKISVG